MYQPIRDLEDKHKKTFCFVFFPGKHSNNVLAERLEASDQMIQIIGERKIHT